MLDTKEVRTGAHLWACVALKALYAVISALVGGLGDCKVAGQCTGSVGRDGTLLWDLAGNFTMELW